MYAVTIILMVQAQFKKCLYNQKLRNKIQIENNYSGDLFIARGKYLLQKCIHLYRVMYFFRLK